MVWRRRQGGLCFFVQNRAQRKTEQPGPGLTKEEPPAPAPGAGGFCCVRFSGCGPGPGAGGRARTGRARRPFCGATAAPAAVRRQKAWWWRRGRPKQKGALAVWARAPRAGPAFLPPGAPMVPDAPPFSGFGRRAGAHGPARRAAAQAKRHTRTKAGVFCAEHTALSLPLCKQAARALPAPAAGAACKHFLLVEKKGGISCG